MKRDTSRLRQDIQRAERRRTPHIEALLGERKPLRGGSLVTLHRRCGKPTCHCADGEGHPAKYLSLKEAGRTRLVYVGAAEEVALAEGNGRYRQFRQHRTAVAKLSKEALGLIDQLGRALTAPPPRRRRRRGS
ncbi:MAG: DUF6788 family protein [Chloroflexota bacterium]